MIGLRCMEHGYPTPKARHSRLPQLRRLLCGELPASDPSCLLRLGQVRVWLRTALGNLMFRCGQKQFVTMLYLRIPWLTETIIDQFHSRWLLNTRPDGDMSGDRSPAETNNEGIHLYERPTTTDSMHWDLSQVLRGQTLSA